MTRRWILAVVALSASLVVGLAGGVVFERQSPATFASAPRPTPSPSTKVDPFAFPPVPTRVVSALGALGRKQTAADVKFPVPSFITTTDVDPSTVHLVLTTDDGSELWIGRTADRLCLLYSSTNPFPTDGIDAGSTCLTPSQFADTGLTLREGNDLWTWNGVSFTTTIAAGSN